MAYHVRRQLREAVAAAITGLATTGARVYQSRVYPLQASELPCLLVYVTTESVDAITVDTPETLERDVELQIEGVARAAADLDDTLDDIAKEVEIALSATITVAGKPILLAYTGCQIEMEADTDAPRGSVTMTFRTLLHNEANAPDVLSY